MNFDQLRYFVSIAQTLNYSRSSQLLNVTQPALSLSISRLEEEIGFPLFLKKGRNIELSPYGERFNTYANTILKNLDTALNDLHSLADEGTSSVSVALNICFNYDYSLAMFDAFKEAYPQYLTDTMILDHSDIVPGLLHGDFSFAVTHNSPSIQKNDSFEYVPIAEYPLFVFVSEHDPLAKQPVIYPEMFDGKNVLVGTFNFKSGATKSQMYGNATINVVPDTAAMMQKVSNNEGVTTGNYTYTQQMKDMGIVRIPYANRRSHYILLWNKNRLFSNADSKFREFCCNYIKTKPLDPATV